MGVRALLGVLWSTAGGKKEIFQRGYIVDKSLRTTDMMSVCGSKKKEGMHVGEGQFKKVLNKDPYKCR